MVPAPVISRDYTLRLIARSEGDAVDATLPAEDRTSAAREAATLRSTLG